MFLEEKLDHFKKAFNLEDFRIPYTDFKPIMKKIESKFIHNGDLSLKFNGWVENLKNVNKEYTIGTSIDTWITNELSNDSNYWWVIVEGELPSDRHRLFDAKAYAGSRLLNLFHNCPFFIIDKKYNWMMAIEPKGKSVREIGKRKSL